MRPSPNVHASSRVRRREACMWPRDPAISIELSGGPARRPNTNSNATGSYTYVTGIVATSTFVELGCDPVLSPNTHRQEQHVRFHSGRRR
jgi:hypothetical protein